MGAGTITLTATMIVGAAAGARTTVTAGAETMTAVLLAGIRMAIRMAIHTVGAAGAVDEVDATGMHMRRITAVAAAAATTGEAAMHATAALY